MADGTTLNSMVGGDTIQTEDFGSAGKIQRIKIALGTKDNDTGDVDSTNPMAVNPGLIAGEDNTANRMLVEARNNYTYINTAATTTIKSASGFLHTLTVLGGTAGTITIYDNTAGSGTVIAAFDSTSAIATYKFDVLFNTGLTVVTGAATKLTVSSR